MGKSLWIIPVLLLFAAIGAPNARADEIVAINFPTITLTGQNLCPPPGGTSPCTESFSTSFEYNNTTESMILSTLSTTSSGALGPFTFTSANVGTNIGDVFTWTNAAGDTITVRVPAAFPTGTITPGNYTSFSNTGFGCVSITCITEGPWLVPASNPTAPGSNPLTVAAVVPEPATPSLMLLGFASLGLMMVMRKRNSRGHQPAA